MTPPPAAAAALPGTRPVPTRPARPVRPARRPSPPAAPAAPERSRPARPRRAPARAGRMARVDTSSASRLLDRLIRSRLWIALVAFSLIGIVAMQLWMLKLNGGIGRAIEHESYLQRENAALSAENAAASAGDLVEQHAVAGGMTIVPPGSLIFLHTRGSADERRAAARLAQPVQESTAGTEASQAASSSTATSTAGAEATQAASSSTATSGAGAEATQAASSPVAATSAGTETTQTASQPEPGG